MAAEAQRDALLGYFSYIFHDIIQTVPDIISVLARPYSRHGPSFFSLFCHGCVKNEEKQTLFLSHPLKKNWVSMLETLHFILNNLEG